MKNFKVLIDTNFFIDVNKFRIEWEEEIKDLLEGKCEFLTLENVLHELKKIQKSGKYNMYGQLALMKIGTGEIKVLKSEKKTADGDILEYSKNNKNLVVATNDSRLRKSLKAKGTKTIYLRGRKKLAVDG
jgi:hypothetical protein